MRIAACALFTLVIAGFDGAAETHSLNKTIFGPTDGDVVFTHDFGNSGSIPVIYDRSLSMNHSQYYCGIYPIDRTIAKPLISSEGWCADTLTNTAMTRIGPGSYSFLEPREVDCRHVSYIDCKAADPTVDEIEFIVTEASIYSCTGVDWPFDHAPLKGPVPPAIALTISIFDADFMSLTGADILPPGVNVSFADEKGQRTDVTRLVSPFGQATTGNQFRFDAPTSNWVFTLGLRAFTTAGTYIVSVAAGSPDYLLEPTCGGQFTRQ